MKTNMKMNPRINIKTNPSAKISSHILKATTYLCAGLTFGSLCYLILHILIKGIPYLKPSLFALEYTSENVSLLPALLTTILMVALALALAVPLGIFTAIYLVEYAKKGSKLVSLVQITSESLSGIPSIVYGLFGMLLFVTRLGWGYSVLSGVCTLAIMILPLIIRSTEEALKSVPSNFREGSFGLGAGKLRTIFRIVLPSAAPGILAGVILAIGRIVGETAALLYTSSTVAQVPGSLMDSARTLSLHMYALSGEGLYTGESYATAVVLLLLVILINSASAKLARKVGKSHG